MQQAYKFELSRISPNDEVGSEVDQDSILKKWDLVKLKVKLLLEGLT